MHALVFRGDYPCTAESASRSANNTSRLPANMSFTYTVRAAFRAYRGHYIILFSFSLLERKKAPER